MSRGKNRLDRARGLRQGALQCGLVHRNRTAQSKNLGLCLRQHHVGKHDLIEPGIWNPIGNGPYMFASDDAWQHNVRIDLVPNPEYNGVREPQNGGVAIVFYQEEDAAYADLLSGNLDI
ncbi:MAG: hypothetical protein B7Y96_04835, partial [Comamonadaceae bacterium 32-67-11]